MKKLLALLLAAAMVLALAACGDSETETEDEAADSAETEVADETDSQDDGEEEEAGTEAEEEESEPEDEEEPQDVDGYVITVADTSEDGTYSVYKVFDISYNEDGEAVCTISEDSPWYDQMFSGDASDVPFTLEDFGDGVDAVSLADYSDSTGILSYIPNVGVPQDAQTVAESDGTGAEMDVQVEEDGVYYITDDDETPVTLAVILPAEMMDQVSFLSVGSRGDSEDSEGMSASEEIISAMGDLFDTDDLEGLFDADNLEELMDTDNLEELMDTDDYDWSDLLDSDALEGLISASGEMGGASGGMGGTSVEMMAVLGYSIDMYGDVLSISMMETISPSEEEIQLVIQLVGLDSVDDLGSLSAYFSGEIDTEDIEDAEVTEVTEG